MCTLTVTVTVPVTVTLTQFLGPQGCCNRKSAMYREAYESPPQDRLDLDDDKSSR